MARVFSFFESEYGLDGVAIGLLDEAKKRVSLFRTTITEGLNSSQLDFLARYNTPNSPEGGLIYATMRRGKPFFLRNTTIPMENKYDAEFVRAMALKSLLFFPPMSPSG